MVIVMALGVAGSVAPSLCRAAVEGDGLPRIGQAPEFTLTGTDGKPVKLSELTARGPVVLYTFIQAFTGT